MHLSKPLSELRKNYFRFYFYYSMVLCSTITFFLIKYHLMYSDQNSQNEKKSCISIILIQTFLFIHFSDIWIWPNLFWIFRNLIAGHQINHVQYFNTLFRAEFFPLLVVQIKNKRPTNFNICIILFLEKKKMF